MSTWSLTGGLAVIGCDTTSATGVQVRLWVLTPQLASQAGAPVSIWPSFCEYLAQLL